MAADCLAQCATVCRMRKKTDCNWRNQPELCDIETQLGELLSSVKPDPLGHVSVQRHLVQGNPPQYIQPTEVTEPQSWWHFG